MGNKIIKISFILLCMLFIAVLCNCCFAVTSDNILESNDYTVTSSATHDIVYIRNVTFNFIKLNVDYEKINTNNTATDLSGLDIDKAFYILRDSKQLLCLIPEKYEPTNDYEYNWYCNNYGFFGYFSSFGTISHNFTIYRFYYDFSTNNWVLLDTGTNQFSFKSPYYILDDNTVSIYSKKANTTSEFMVYEAAEPPPSNEELIANCDFKVNFKFAPESNDFPSDNVGSRWSWFCRLLVEHSLSDWETNYNVKVKMSVVNKTQPNGLYYDLYNSDGEEIQKKKHIKEEILTESINFGDFFLFFTDNLQDTFKFEYEIYNKSDELLMKKIYTFKFTKSGLTAFNSTGTIMSENIQDSTGQDIENGGNSFDTNGYDNTTTDNDYYDVSNLDNLASSASDTINLAKKCFEILPGFIWVMVGVFLSVCIALRILGR